MSDHAEKPINQSVSKLLQLLNALSESRTPMRLQEIAAGISMPQATVLRYLNALMQEGYVFQEELSGRYALTWRICHWGEQVTSHMSLRTLSGNLITDLSGQLAVGISLVVEQEHQCMYLDCVYEPKLMGPTLHRIGKQSPLHCTSSGKLLLTEYAPAELEQFVETQGLPPLTKQTITTKDALLAELQQVRTQGFAMDNEECEEGLRCVAVPVYDYRERISAAISAFGSVDKMTPDVLEQTILPTLKSAAAQLSFRMGSAGSADR